MNQNQSSMCTMVALGDLLFELFNQESTQQYFIWFIVRLKYTYIFEIAENSMG